MSSFAVGFFDPEQCHVFVEKDFTLDVIGASHRFSFLTAVFEVPGEEKGGFLIVNLTILFAFLLALRLELLCLFVLPMLVCRK